MFLIVIVVIVLVLLIYFKGIKPLNYWTKRGVLFKKAWPFIGNMGEPFLQRRAHAYLQQEIYKTFSGQRRYYGFYNFNKPTLVITDPDLIKQIIVKEFETFPDHRRFAVDDVDPLWSDNLFAMKGGQKWHDLRSTLSPSFTSNKLRMMFELMKDCSKQFANYFMEQKGTIVKVEMKDAFTRFTNDVIATTAFGVTCNSLKEKENEFYLMGKEATNFSGINAVRLMMHLLCPEVVKLLKIPIFTKRVGTFFRSLIKSTIKIREEQRIVRPDMIHLMMEARKGGLKYEESNKGNGYDVSQELPVGPPKRQKSEITDEDITAQALIFFFAGFDSVSTMMCHSAYELALNIDIQEKLRKEVDETLEGCNGEFTYESLLGMKYLDMVISESLRKWPSFDSTDRRCTRPFTIEPKMPEEKPLHLEPETEVLFPIYAIQRDAKYFPNPDKFDPERFNEENKKNIKPFTYFPFGAGPRNCIGMRFALLEGKLIIAEILRKFEIVPIEDTPIPLKIGSKSTIPSPDGGVWLGLKPRSL